MLLAFQIRVAPLLPLALLSLSFPPLTPFTPRPRIPLSHPSPLASLTPIPVAGSAASLVPGGQGSGSGGSGLGGGPEGSAAAPAAAEAGEGGGAVGGEDAAGGGEGRLIVTPRDSGAAARKQAGGLLGAVNPLNAVGGVESMGSGMLPAAQSPPYKSPIHFHGRIQHYPQMSPMSTVKRALYYPKRDLLKLPLRAGLRDSFKSMPGAGFVGGVGSGIGAGIGGLWSGAAAAANAAGRVCAACLR